jgi:hypothetical protein
LRRGRPGFGHLLFQLYQDRQWSTYAAEHDCRVVEERDGNRWSTVGLNGRPRFGTSARKEKWVCSDGMIYWRDRL